MDDSRRLAGQHRSPGCPMCGNERIVRVTQYVDGQPDLYRAFCPGPRGCRGWFDPITLQRAPAGWDGIDFGRRPASERGGRRAGAG